MRCVGIRSIRALWCRYKVVGVGISDKKHRGDNFSRSRVDDVIVDNDE